MIPSWKQYSRCHQKGNNVALFFRRRRPQLGQYECQFAILIVRLVDEESENSQPPLEDAMPLWQFALREWLHLSNLEHLTPPYNCNCLGASVYLIDFRQTHASPIVSTL